MITGGQQQRISLCISLVHLSVRVCIISRDRFRLVINHDDYYWCPGHLDFHFVHTEHICHLDATSVQTVSAADDAAESDHDGVQGVQISSKFRPLQASTLYRGMRSAALARHLTDPTNEPPGRGMSDVTGGASSGQNADDSINRSIADQGSAAESMDNGVRHENQLEILPSCSFCCCHQGQAQSPNGSPKHAYEVKVSFGRVLKGFADGSRNLQVTESELTDGRRALRGGRVVSTEVAYHSIDSRGETLEAQTTGAYQPIDSRRETLGAQSTSSGGGVKTQGGRLGSLNGVARRLTLKSLGGQVKGQSLDRYGIMDGGVQTSDRFRSIVRDNPIKTEGNRFGSLDSSVDAQGDDRYGSLDSGLNMEDTRHQNVAQNSFAKAEENRSGSLDRIVGTGGAAVQTQGNQYQHVTQTLHAATQDDGVHTQGNRFSMITQILGVATEEDRYRSSSLDDRVHVHTYDRFRNFVQEDRVVTKKDQFDSLEGIVDAEGDHSGSMEGGSHKLVDQYRGVTRVDDELDKEGNLYGSQDSGENTEGGRVGAITVTLKHRDAVEGSQSTSLDSRVDVERYQYGSVDGGIEAQTSHWRSMPSEIDPKENHSESLRVVHPGGEQSETVGTGQHQTTTGLDPRPVDAKRFQSGSLDGHAKPAGDQSGLLHGSVDAQQTRVSGIQAIQVQENPFGLITGENLSGSLDDGVVLEAYQSGWLDGSVDPQATRVGGIQVHGNRAGSITGEIPSDAAWSLKEINLTR